MVDPVGGPGSNQLDINQLLQASQSGDFSSAIPEGSGISPDDPRLTRLYQIHAGIQVPDRGVLGLL